MTANNTCKTVDAVDAWAGSLGLLRYGGDSPAQLRSFYRLSTLDVTHVRSFPRLPLFPPQSEKVGKPGNEATVLSHISLLMRMPGI